MPTDVSIITVYYNTPEELLRLHESLNRFLPDGQWEWIVADNHSSENLESKLSGVIYLRFEANFGFAKANNLAAQKASAPYLFFLNPDCLLLENVLPVLLDTMKSAAVAGPQVLNSDGSIQLSFGPFLSVFREAYQKCLTRYEKSRPVQRWLRNKMAFSPDYVSGCAMMIGSELFRSIGGFDEDFFLYEEDVDLCKRVRDRGLDVRYIPAAKIQHLRNRSVQQMRDSVQKEYRRSQLYYYRKHNNTFQQWLLQVYLSLMRRS